MSRTTLRLARETDFVAYAGEGIPAWCAEWVGYVAERDGEIIAIGIVCWDKWGRVWGQFDRRAPLSPFLMHRLARRTLAHVREVGVPILHAYCDERMPGADKWLRRLGFRPGPILPPDPRPVWICTFSN